MMINRVIVVVPFQLVFFSLKCFIRKKNIIGCMTPFLICGPYPIEEVQLAFFIFVFFLSQNSISLIVFLSFDQTKSTKVNRI
ncbi:hypothetical protein HanRHA438_Chr05g0220181 [Helianthus annuus]|nr:hypothetical protein HanRHA438_Chr05g0220181 [Helianthus annuus]